MCNELKLEKDIFFPIELSIIPFLNKGVYGNIYKNRVLKNKYIRPYKEDKSFEEGKSKNISKDIVENKSKNEGMREIKSISEIESINIDNIIEKEIVDILDAAYIDYINSEEKTPIKERIITPKQLPKQLLIPKEKYTVSKAKKENMRLDIEDIFTYKKEEEKPGQIEEEEVVMEYEGINDEWCVLTV